MAAEDRKYKGKKLTNMRYNADFHTIVTNLALISPRAYHMFRDAFTGPHFRSLIRNRSKIGQFKVGIVNEKFDLAAGWAASRGYDGPFVLSVDDTNLVPALRSYNDAGEWTLIGMHGQVEVFASYEELIEKGQAVEREMLAEKVRVWLLIIPIPGVPSRPVAIMPIRNQVAWPELQQWHDEVELKLAACNLHHVSYNVDGVSTERGLTHDLFLEALASGNVRTWSFKHLVPSKPDICIEVPLLANGKPRVSGSDGKHAKKNGRGAALSGARVLVLGRYLVYYGQLAELALSDRTPLLKSDIIGLDKQDDRAAARLFSSAVIKHIEATQPESVGLAIYTYIIGSIVDAQQNRKISHQERLVLLFRGRFFLKGWREYITSHPHYSTQTHFIAPELYDILNIFINSMISLILIYRDYFPNLPLLSWIHSTEGLEHFYGCARANKSDFTMAEFVQNIKKTILLMAGQLRAGVSQASANSHRSGYHHFYHNLKDIDLEALKTWPSNSDVVAAILTAWCEAQGLLKACAMGEGYIPASTFRLTLNSAELEIGNLSEDYIATASMETDHSGESVTTQLNTMLRRDRHDLPSVATSAETALVNAGLAATSFYLHEAHYLSDDEDDIITAEEEMFKSMRNMLVSLHKELSTRSQDLIDSSHSTSLVYKPLPTSSNAAMKRPLPSTRYVASDGKFTFKSLYTERELHETDEAKSAVSSRWTKAAASDAVLSSKPADLPSALRPFTSASSDDETSIPVLKSALVREITRAFSAKLSTNKNTATGVSRRIRWKSSVGCTGVGADAEDSDDGDDADLDLQSDGDRQVKHDSRQLLTKEIVKELGRRVYEDIEICGGTYFPFVSSGISALSPLRPGSWVAVVFQNELHIGEVKIIYEKGGGSRPRHDYVTSCKDLNSLSRFVVLTYNKYEDKLSPMTQRLKARLDVVPTFLFLKPVHLLVSLDTLSSFPMEVVATLDHGLNVLRPAPRVSDLIHNLYSEATTLVECAVLLGQAAAMRKPSKKRSVQQRRIDHDDTLDEEPGALQKRR